jgi:hypothetical protein
VERQRVIPINIDRLHDASDSSVMLWQAAIK